LNFEQDILSGFVIHAMVEVLSFSQYPLYDARINLNGWFAFIDGRTIPDTLALN